jgi:hypothetical protein
MLINHCRNAKTSPKVYKGFLRFSIHYIILLLYKLAGIIKCAKKKKKKLLKKKSQTI